MGEFSLQDLYDARSLAVRGNDVLALQCWDYLIPRLEARLAVTERDDIELSGPFSSYQQARNIRLLIQSMESVEFRLACGPMIGDSRDVLRGLLGIGIL
jgi:hypothetical protein